MQYRIANPPCITPILKLSCIFLTCLFLFVDSASPQSPAPVAPPQPDSAPYTLHVYTDLIQIPTLVLSPQLRPVPPIPREKFNITLDSGPRFHPTQLQIEGDEPITLAIFVDLSSDARSLHNALEASVPSFAANSLRPQDHISIFAIDCNMIRTALNMPAADPIALSNAFNAAINSPRILGENGDLHCSTSRRLWNDIGTVAETVANQPGRHVILAITDGVDHSSPLQWETLRHFCIRHSIAIFGISPALPRMGPSLARATFLENAFDLLAQSSGGMILHTSPDNVSSNLQHVIDLVRGRYILQFPRPDNGTVGLHSIIVTVGRSNDFVRTTGISYPSRDPALQSAPDTIPSTPSPAEYGDRKPLTSPH